MSEYVYKRPVYLVTGNGAWFCRDRVQATRMTNVGISLAGVMACE